MGRGMSCPSETKCWAVGDLGKIEASTTVVVAPTPAPLLCCYTQRRRCASITTTVSQAVTISELASSDYIGTLKAQYEKAYGVAVGACDSACVSYYYGIYIASSAATRRAATVTFVMTLSGVADTSAYTGGCSGTCTTNTLAAEILTATGQTVTVSTMATASVTTEAPTPMSGNSASSTTVSRLLGVVCSLLILMNSAN